MRTTTWKMIPLALAVALFAALFPARAGAQYGDNRAPNGDDSVISQTVARISFLEGDASYTRGDDPDNWQPAVLNVPVTLGDRVYTGDRSRMELQVQGGTLVRLAPGSDLTALNLTDDVKQLSLTSGTATFQVRRLRRDEVFEVDTPNVAVTFEAAGTYRIDVDADGNSRVVVRRGEVTVAAGGGQIPVSAGDEISIQGFDNPNYDVTSAGARDSWDQWVSFRDSRYRQVRSYAYVNAEVVGAEDLDQYGRWEDVPQYGRAWTPSVVSAGWAPYRDGQWIWQDPWGWTWVGAEPWGWAPYHYGRWVNSSSRWYWVPEGRQTAAIYSPALVAFVGGGPGWSASMTIGGGGGYVGWFPLAPRDPFIPWWGDRRRAEVNVNVTNVNYVNRTYVTVVNQNTFVSGGVVTGNYIRDPQIVRQVVASPIQRGAIPVVPTAASLRVARVGTSRQIQAARPPAAILNRSVVTRVAPPVAPASFDTKMRVIRENRGAPVAPAAAARLAVEAGGARAAAPVRPATSAAGGGGRGVGLTPRREGAKNVRPQAVTAPRGKALATTERPLVSAPSAASSPAAPAPARIAPGAVVTPGERMGRPGNRPETPGRTAAPPPSAAPQTQTPPTPARPGPDSWRERQPQDRQTPPPPSGVAPAPAKDTTTRPVPPGRQRQAPPVEETKAPPPAARETPTTPIPPGRQRQLDQQRQAQSPADQAAPPPRPAVKPDQPAPSTERRGTPEANPPRREVSPPNRETPRPPAREVAPPARGNQAPARVEGDRPGNRGVVRPPTSEERKAAADKKKKEQKDKEKEPPPPPPSD